MIEIVLRVFVLLAIFAAVFLLFQVLGTSYAQRHSHRGATDQARAGNEGANQVWTGLHQQSYRVRKQIPQPTGFFQPHGAGNPFGFHIARQ